MDNYRDKEFDQATKNTEELIDELAGRDPTLALQIQLQLETIKWLRHLSKQLDAGVKFDANAPCNVYGEGLVDGIQNAIERGQRGISTHGG